MKIFYCIVLLICTCQALNILTDKLGEAIDKLGHKMKIKSSVKGAVFDAISSSTPEFLTSLVACFAFIGILGPADPNAFADVGIGTIGGSAIFNILIIPFFSILVVKKKEIEKLEVDKSALLRDLFFYIGSVGFLFFAAFQGALTPTIGLAMVIFYLIYIVTLLKQPHDENFEYKQIVESYPNLLKRIIFFLIPIALIVHLSVTAAEVLATELNIPRIVMALIVLAAVTSVPDLILSVRSAKNGEMDASISNAIGSNSFDILICLGLIIAVSGKSIPITFKDVVPIFSFIAISAISYFVSFYFRSSKRVKLSILGSTYVCFVYYLI